MTPLKPLHPDSSLSQSKLEQYAKLSTEVLLLSLCPGQPGVLKVKQNGTIMDGHHRIKLLRERGINVDMLPREII